MSYRPVVLEHAAAKLLEAGYKAEEVQSAKFDVQAQLQSVYDMGRGVRTCSACPLQAECNIPAVAGMGPWNAPLMIIGDGPGEDDAQLGAPMIGATGQLLTLILSKLGVDRRDVYLTNAVKCHSKRQLTFEEVAECSHHLFNELAYVRPRVILAMGNRALRIMTSDPEAMISKNRGKWLTEQSASAIPFMATYNLGHLFHQEGAKLLQVKKEIFADVKEACIKADLIREVVTA